MGVCIMAPITGWMLIQCFLTWKPPTKFIISHLWTVRSKSEGGSFITSSSLPWLIVLLLFLGIAIYVIRLEPCLCFIFLGFSSSFFIWFHTSDVCAQITKIHEAVNSAQSAKPQLLDAPCRRWGTGLILSKIFMVLDSELKNWDHNCAHRPFPASFQSKRGISRG